MKPVLHPDIFFVYYSFRELEDYVNIVLGNLLIFHSRIVL